MPKLALRLPENVPGDFYVDATCIDCDACRQIAPEVFRDHGEQTSVFHQPENEAETRRALMALVACPTASIGTTGRQNKRAGIDAFPHPVADDIYFCGFTSEHSFGAWSYLIVRPPERGGNVFVDSPRYASQLGKRIEALGGVSLMFLSHRDDIADHARYARRFNCRRIMHADDHAARHGVEQVITGPDALKLDEDLTIIPTPGHTRGHMVLLYRDKFLFTGDHLAWSPARATLTAFRSACWYSWTEQTRSMARLLDYSFEWVLPGHGRIHHAPAAEMHAHLARCIAWMKATP
ncbi:MAG TPA: MBL fold metallo-hydrolase [Pyrinomonadaceae bacterium]|jgi:glyoxylase-like metal-dependent hydrolase (beta-lactamase superfamily II)/ferredoxin